MATVEDLVIRIRGDAKELERELAKAEGKVKASSASMERSFAGAARGINVIRTGVTALGAGLAASGIIQVGRQIREALDFGGELNDASARVGVGVEALQELRFAAQGFGVDTAGVDTALTKLNKKIADAAAGNEKASKTFKALHIEVRDAAGGIRPVEDVLADVADRIASIEDPATRTKAVMELFGKSGARLIPILQGGSAELAALRIEAHRTGAVLSEDLDDRADELGDRLDQLSQAIRVQLTSALVELGPLLVSTSEGLLRAASSFNLWREQLSDDRLSGHIRSLDQYLRDLEKFKPEDLEARAAAQRNLNAALAERDGATRARHTELAAQIGFDEFGNPIRGSGLASNRGTGGIVFDDSPRKRGGGGGKAQKLKEAFDPLESVLRRFREEENAREEASQRLRSIERDMTTEFLALTEQRVAAIRQEESERIKALDEIEQRFAGHADKLREIEAARQDTHRNAAEKIRQASDESADRMKEAAKGFGDFFGSVVSGLVLQTEQDFGALVKSVLASLLEVGASNAFTKLFELVTQTAPAKTSGGTGGGAGGFFGSLISTLLGATAFADGGIVTRPVLGLVGEAGPEAVIPLKQLSRGSGEGVVVNVIQSAPGVDISASRNPRTGEIDIAVESSVRRMYARGGARDLPPQGRHHAARGA